jgi:3-oxoacyl-[acyl-carrier protein] reductase
LAKEIGQRQVTVNVVSPGITDTDGLILPQPAIDRLIEQTPLRRLGQPADISDVVGFWANDDAHWMTGQNGSKHNAIEAIWAKCDRLH